MVEDRFQLFGREPGPVASDDVLEPAKVSRPVLALDERRLVDKEGSAWGECFPHLHHEPFLLVRRKVVYGQADPHDVRRRIDVSIEFLEVSRDEAVRRADLV